MKIKLHKDWIFDKKYLAGEIVDLDEKIINHLDDAGINYTIVEVKKTVIDKKKIIEKDME